MHPDFKSIGFATYSGSYSAYEKGKGWHSKNELKIPPINSYEYFFHQVDLPNFYLSLNPTYWTSHSISCFPEKRKFRSIGAGVSEVEFFNTNLTNDFDMLIYLSSTSSTNLRSF